MAVKALLAWVLGIRPYRRLVTTSGLITKNVRSAGLLSGLAPKTTPIVTQKITKPHRSPAATARAKPVAGRSDQRKKMGPRGEAPSRSASMRERKPAPAAAGSERKNKPFRYGETSARPDESPDQRAAKARRSKAPPRSRDGAFGGGKSAAAASRGPRAVKPEGAAPRSRAAAPRDGDARPRTNASGVPMRASRVPETKAAARRRDGAPASKPGGRSASAGAGKAARPSANSKRRPPPAQSREARSVAVAKKPHPARVASREREESREAAPREVSIQQVRRVKIDANSDGQRVDNFLLKHLPGVPKSHVYRLLRSGQVRVDGGRVKADRRLVAAEEVRIPPVRMADPREAIRPPDRVLDELRESVVFEDDHYLAINKPDGISSHGGTGQLYGVIEAIRAWDKYSFIELCHRLDRDTSGLLLLAKSRPALLRAQSAFREGDLTKRYFALLSGKWKGEDRDVDAALVKVRLGDVSHVQLDEDGKPSKSRFSPRAKFQNAVLCEVEIFSGRTHQIRVHALALGHPVVGDAKYGERAVNHPFRALGLKRMFLHSHFLQLPASGEFPKLLLNAVMPDELRDFLAVLERKK